MRELTFAGYLTKYVRRLSANDTTRLSTLADEAARNNPRLREPLLLYAMFTDKTDQLMRQTKDETLQKTYEDLLRRYSAAQMEQALQTDALPAAYKKVWSSYVYTRDRHRADDHTKELMRRKIRKLQQTRHITNYRIYTSLGLNPGNVNAWLKHGVEDKVSLSAARAMLQFVEAWKEP